MIDLNTNRVELLSWFQLKFPDLVQSMKDANHHYDQEHLNPYHLEGDVWSHTMMVFKMAEVFSPSNNYVKWSSLLHDIGKPRAMEKFEKHIDFNNMSDEEIYNKYKYLVDEFIEKEN